MGLIDQNEAKRRRKELEKEASFLWGDGRGQQVRQRRRRRGHHHPADQHLRGLVIGIAQMGMDWLAALQTFTLLTIGDGIVTRCRR